MRARSSLSTILVIALCVSTRVTSADDAKPAPPPPPAPNELQLGVKSWRIIDRESGPVNYYSIVDDPTMPFIRAQYRPPTKTAVLGVQVAESDRQRARKLRWTWRAMTLPVGGDECASGKEDAAATIYVSWKRGLRWYTLKYEWSSVGRKGAICKPKRNPFVAQDTVIQESGGPLATWKTEEIDLKAEFRSHFENGDPKADVPEFQGVALLTDGDDTNSESAADYADFVLVR
jgi:hypothetical protein